MIRKCSKIDFENIYEIINNSALVYKGIIPADRWKEPYMSREELSTEMDEGVVFWGFEEEGKLAGVMGIQQIQDVTLIRHSYVHSSRKGQGIGGKLLAHLCNIAESPILVGTWADAYWAINFYEKHGFQLVSQKEKDRLLRKYWSIPERQIETSIVLKEKRSTKP
jgi:N-acetylglutamate synthase-like GNAT family acetyltransferase